MIVALQAIKITSIIQNPFLEESTPTPAGNGYFYSYGNALFIVINANNYNAADHKALIKKLSKKIQMQNGVLL